MVATVSIFWECVNTQFESTAHYTQFGECSMSNIQWAELSLVVHNSTKGKLQKMLYLRTFDHNSLKQLLD